MPQRPWGKAFGSRLEHDVNEAIVMSLSELDHIYTEGKGRLSSNSLC
jgi:hypothetical protein